MRRSLRSIESEGEGEPYHGIGSLVPEALSSRTRDSGLPSRRAAEAVGIDQQYDGDPQGKDECCENQQQWDLPFGFEVDASVTRRSLASAGSVDASLRPLKRDGIWLNRYRALASCLSMIFSENRYTLFRIML